MTAFWVLQLNDWFKVKSQGHYSYNDTWAFITFAAEILDGFLVVDKIHVLWGVFLDFYSLQHILTPRLNSSNVGNQPPIHNISILDPAYQF